MKRVYLALFIALVLTLVSATLGCDSSMEGYRAFTFNEVAHFSFEYPAHYKKTSAGAEVEDKIIHIGLRDEVPSEGSNAGFIGIKVEGAGITYPDATVALEHTLSIFVDSEPYDEDAEQAPGRLLERSTLTVAGIPAELIVYSYGYDYVRDSPSDPWVLLLRIAREVYFDYNGLIWNIVIESDEDRAEVAKADFEHLLETFQILE